MQCKCGGELYADNQKITRFLACIKCKQWYEIVEYNQPKFEFPGETIKMPNIKVGD